MQDDLDAIVGPENVADVGKAKVAAVAVPWRRNWRRLPVIGGEEFLHELRTRERPSRYRRSSRVNEPLRFEEELLGEED